MRYAHVAIDIMCAHINQQRRIANMKEERGAPVHYFWTGWFDGQSYTLLAGVFCLLSFVDLLATLRLMPGGMSNSGIHEANKLANYILQHYHTPGVIALKVLMVLIVLGCTWGIKQANERLSRQVLWAGCLIMSVICVLHLAIITRLLFHTLNLFGY
jgi:hypothetical protein